jgi:hypothetical protein
MYSPVAEIFGCRPGCENDNSQSGGLIDAFWPLVAAAAAASIKERSNEIYPARDNPRLP